MHLKILIAVVAMAAFGAANAQKVSNCESSCGNVSIIFPFGLREGCYYSSDFRVTCNRSSGQPIPFLGNSTGNIVISNMSSSKSELEIMMFVARNCYNISGPERRNRPSLRLRDIRISTKNRFVAIGCDTHAYFRGIRGNATDGTGCISRCGSNSRFTNGSCSGVGCCEVAVPEGMRSFNITLRSYNNHTNILDFNPCSYGFFVEEGKFNFSTKNLRDFRSVGKMPMLLDWAIGNSTCDIASKDVNNFLCKGNSICDQSYTGLGYRCRCLEGYEGNPYISNDCKNIDECAFQNHVCEHNCIDTVGNYTCKCRKGYFGDGRRDGTGCTADPSVLTKIAAGVSISMGILLLVGAIFAFYKLIQKTKEKRRKARFFNRNGGLLLKQQESTDDGLVDKTTLFTAKELEKATDHFNNNRILGQGGQGTVYKGMLTDGRIVAVKRSKIVDESQLEQFINEVVILSQVNHRNVVKLLGCCLETEVPLLVSEFIPNKTLYEQIQNETEEFPMTLNTRLRIATEIAGALTYLHTATSIPIYHRDIKSTNILMDDKFRAKVSDFGTSRFVSIDQTHLTTLVKGTFGYLDPEYFQSSQFTEKSDVYSFGVVLVELLTGERPISVSRIGEHRSLATHFMLAMEEGEGMAVFDRRIVEEGGQSEVMEVANLAVRCLNLNGKNRPTMKEVVLELESIKAKSCTSGYGFEKLEYHGGIEE